MKPPEEESNEEQVEAVDELIDLSQKLFLLSNPGSAENEAELVAEVQKTVTERGMVTFYPQYCEKFGWMMDDGVLEAMKAKNDEKLKELDDKIKDAEENLGDSEVREALLAKAEFFVKIGDKDAALKGFEECEKKTVAIGQKMEMVFSVMRLHIFHNDWAAVKTQIAKLKDLLEQPGGGDWERKNRLKVYEGLFCMATRSFKKATELFLESLSTFTTYELMSYDRFIFYTIICSLISLKRTDLKEKVTDAPEVLSVVDKLPGMADMLNSLQSCKYKMFMTAFPLVADEVARCKWLSVHHRYFTREARLVAYSQFLQSYKSVTTASMAAAFAVGEDFLDRELSHFIVAGRLNCKIDKAGGVLQTNRPDTKNALYQQYIKEGDQLLNRIQKLSRVIDL